MTIMVVIVFVNSARAVHEIFLDDGVELRQYIKDYNHNISVTVWFKHLRFDSEQNKRNLMATASLQKAIDNFHRNSGIVYAEADLSEYNPDKADSFEFIAYQWHINVRHLNEGPMIMVLMEGDGEVFWASDDVPIIVLLEKVDAAIGRLEKNNLGIEPEKAMITIDESDISEFERLNPWNKHKDIPLPQEHQKAKPKFNLKEPEKSFV
ncbi:unnamed protein product [Moneuplotes crassus]|uniref:Uncharacterized protein n=2 Tax=Euplotes crassus TaxID=5936 RepID=A0AAD1XIB7_EUPCR|nr:unnamed protein product [Moneuplotes crassus]